MGLAFGAAHQAPQLRAVPRQLDLVRGPAGPQPTQGQGPSRRRPAAVRPGWRRPCCAHAPGLSKPPMHPRPPTQRPAPPAPAPRRPVASLQRPPECDQRGARWANAPNAAVVHRPGRRLGPVLHPTPCYSPVGTIRLTRMPGRPDQSVEHDSSAQDRRPTSSAAFSQVARRGGRQGLGHLGANVAGRAPVPVRRPAPPRRGKTDLRIALRSRANGPWTPAATRNGITPRGGATAARRSGRSGHRA